MHRMRGIGGSERHLLALLPALAERGIEPFFVGLDDPAWRADDFYDALQVPAIRIAAPRDVDPVLLARVVRATRADIVHTHLVHADLYGGIASKLRGAQLVSTKHNDDPFRAGPFRFVERGLSHLADRVITITDALRRFTIEEVGLRPDKVETIHYGMDDLPAAWGDNPPDDVPDGARILLAVARLTPQKGIDVAIRALPLLSDDTVLVVLGEGPERDVLGRLAHELGVDHRVRLAGRVPDVAAWLRRATLLVHPARWEGFGLGVLEGMLAGLPIVASNVSSLPELVVDGETGILVLPDDPSALALGIASALEQPQLGAAGRERAHREFSVARMAEHTVALYRAL
ncbi:MAG TPA: glycosyltransferase family 4 protein [Gaiellaceae bacterium]|jgi:Glycosyltransferase|nr:glycosyltransferase family 4 protein [Gaiellaceae bacterium]